MVYAIVPRDGLRNAAPGAGVVIDIHWYERDPEVEPGLSPFLVDQDILPVPDVSQVTEAMIDACLARRQAHAEAHLNPGDPQPRVRQMIGRARVVDERGPRAAEADRAERARRDGRR